MHSHNSRAAAITQEFIGLPLREEGGAIRRPSPGRGKQYGA